jgi:hypothetical protein
MGDCSGPRISTGARKDLRQGCRPYGAPPGPRRFHTASERYNPPLHSMLEFDVTGHCGSLTWCGECASIRRWLLFAIDPDRGVCFAGIMTYTCRSIGLMATFSKKRFMIRHGLRGCHG